MRECFEAAHRAVFLAIKKQGSGVFEDPDMPGVLVQEVGEDEWPLGFDAADGGTTCSIGALLDGRVLVYAAAGDSCSLLGVPQSARGAARTIELVPTTCWGTNLKEELSSSVADASSLLANANANARVNVVC